MSILKLRIKKQSFSCLVAIPVYKDFSLLSDTEIASFKQALLIFHSRKICLFGPEEFDFSPYQIFADSLNISLCFKKFNSLYFSNIDGYNRLLLSEAFYEQFLEYYYLLIYQLDCWVFKDELDYWCSKGYDYIGAPWVDNRNLYKVINNRKRTFFEAMILLQKGFRMKKDWCIGNGGFSLRKIRSSKLVIQKLQRYIEKFGANEDVFWAIYVPLVYPLFKVPDINEAIGFSFEMNPEKFYCLNNFELPFGCHAWQKYNYDFWKKWIII